MLWIDVGNWYMAASVELKSWDGKANLWACWKFIQSDRMNSYLGLQGTVNEDGIALNFGTWDSAVIVYHLFEVGSSFSFQSTRRQWYQFRLGRLTLNSFSLLTDSCIQHYAPSKKGFSNGTKKMLKWFDGHGSNVSLCDIGLVWISF